MTEKAQLLYLALGYAAFDQESAVLVAVTGMVGGLLGVHAVVEQVYEQLRVALGLHGGAHHPEDGPERPFARGKAWDKGVQRALARGYGVGMAGFEAEQVTAVVEADSGALGDDAAAECPVKAVYERAAVAVGIHGAEVGRVPAGRRLRGPLRGAFRRDALAQARGVVLRDQAFRSGLRGVPERGVTYLVVQVLEGQLLRLDLEVDALRASASEGREIEALQDVQHLEGGDALAGRRDLVDRNALVFGRYRLDERRLVGGEVLFGQEPTGLPGRARDAGSDLTPVEGVGTVYRDGREGGR